MPYTLIISNNNQSVYNPVIVNTIPLVNPEDLIWTPGGGGLTLASIVGTIFPTIQGDQVVVPYWYHGGNPQIATNSIQIHGCNLITATNSVSEVISDQQQKGLFELRATPILPIVGTPAVAANAQLNVVGHNYIVGDLVELKDTGTVIPAGIYKVTLVIGLDDFEIDTPAVTGIIGAVPTVNLFKYYWDEVYTTPMGLYNAQPDSIVTLGVFDFFMTGDNSEELRVYISDPNIIPKANDSIIFQKFFDTENSFTNESTTDGLNNVTNYSQAETYEFKIISVVGTPVVPILPTLPYIDYAIILDKSFKPITTSMYMLVLLNRKGTTVDRELFSDTWKLTQVYRSQLLGDPYNFTGVTLPIGRKNYLNYQGGELLGVKNLLQGIMPEAESPFVILDFADEIKDRIYSLVDEFEVHLPTIMLQGERTPVILINSNPYSLVNPVYTDLTGVGTYSALYLKYPTVSPAVRYGWVFYDLRIVVIDHNEMGTVMGYNANRNFTLPTPILPTPSNSLMRSTNLTPLLITNVSNANPIVITTLVNNNLVTADKVFISGVTGNTLANTTTFYYINVLTPTTFEIYQDLALTTPIDGTTSGVYTGGGLMYGFRLPYEYFFTYRLIGAHYDSLPYATLTPFNYQLTNLVSDDENAAVDITFPQLTHLVDNNVLEGFEATSYEIISGRYVQDSTDLYTISGVEDVVIMIPELLTAAGVQNTHAVSFMRKDYESQVLNSLSAPYSEQYDILNVAAQKIYNLLSSPLPSTLFTSEGEWTIGLLKYKSQARQYKLTFDAVIPAANWNGTQNPSFVAGDPLMNEKLITEVEFLIQDANGNTVDSPYIYAKVSPPIRKDNLTDLKLSLSLDF